VNTALPMLQDSRNTGVHLVQNPVDYGYPPLKRQKLDDGTVFKAVAAEKVPFYMRNRKRILPKRPLCESISFKEENYRGVLLTYMKRIGKVEKLTFQSVRDTENKIRNNSLFICTVEACKFTGKGRGPTKKKSIQMACLDILQKLGVVPEEIKRDTMGIPSKHFEPVLPVKSIVENTNYLKGNFRGALNEYLIKHHPHVNLLFESDIVLVEKQSVFVTTCTADRGEFKGCGHATKKKRSTHLACLDFMLNIGLLTKEQHLEKYPSATAAIEVGMDKRA